MPNKSSAKIVDDFVYEAVYSLRLVGKFKIAKAQGDGEECMACLERVKELREGMGLEDEGTYF